LVIPIGIFEVTNHKNEVFDFISLCYKITDLQATETVWYIPRGAK